MGSKVQATVLSLNPVPHPGLLLTRSSEGEALFAGLEARKEGTSSPSLDSCRLEIGTQGVSRSFVSSHSFRASSFNGKETASPAGKHQQETAARNKASGEKEAGARNTEKAKQNWNDARQARGGCCFVAVPRKAALMRLLPSGCRAAKARPFLCSVTV